MTSPDALSAAAACATPPGASTPSTFGDIGGHGVPCRDSLLPSSPPGGRQADEVDLLARELVGACYKYHRAVGTGDMLAALDAAAPIDAGGIDSLSGRVEIVRRLLPKEPPLCVR